MFSFIINRMNKRYVTFLAILATVLVLLQVYPSISNIAKKNIFMDSPYTRWISVDSFNTISVVFFILLPLIAALPAGILLKKDLDNGFLNQVIIKTNLRKVIISYLIVSFGLGFFIIFVPLTVNFATYFLLYPNVIPDNFLNVNILVIPRNTLFIELYYTHPFIHAFLSIIWASFWGGLFALFVTANSLWLKNHFVAVISGLLFQVIMLLVSSLFLPYLKGNALAPAEFTRESAFSSDVNLYLVLVVTAFVLVYVIFLLIQGVRKRVFW